MRKRLISNDSQVNGADANSRGLNLEQLAQIELTSEEEAHPIESALTANDAIGWKAATPGAQTIRIVFDAPQQISKMHLLFREREQARTQEFVLRWLPDGEHDYQVLLRQQYTFSPPHTTVQSEDYTLNLKSVRAIELLINPDINGGDARASLAMLQMS